MTASTLTAEQMLEKAIDWLLDDGKIGPQTANRLRRHCLPETDKQIALGLLQMYGRTDIDCHLMLSVSQVELIRSVVERCPDDYSQFSVKVDGIMQGPPPPPSKPKLAVGQVWRRRDGQTATVIGSNNFNEEDDYPFCAGGEWYTDEGCYFSDKSSHPFDLVECLHSRSCEQ